VNKKGLAVVPSSNFMNMCSMPVSDNTRIVDSNEFREHHSSAVFTHHRRLCVYQVTQFSPTPVSSCDQVEEGPSKRYLI